MPEIHQADQLLAECKAEFKRVDADGSGKIDVDELLPLLTKFFAKDEAPTKDTATKIMLAIDTDGNMELDEVAFGVESAS